MPETLDTLVGEVKRGERRLTYVTLRGRNSEEAERIVEGFVSILRRMTREERISVSRHGGFTRWERWVWAARFPDEPPLVNGGWSGSPWGSPTSTDPRSTSSSAWTRFVSSAATLRSRAVSLSDVPIQRDPKNLTRKGEQTPAAPSHGGFEVLYGP